MLKVVTINLLSDLSRWQARRDLLARGLAEEDADLIALQEVKLPENTALWLADRLNAGMGSAPPYIVHLVPKTGREAKREAIAILTRLPVESASALDLGGQNRVVQAVRVRVGAGSGRSRSLVCANGHFYWHTGESVERDRQVERLLEWLEGQAAGLPSVVCGDFNAEPETRAIRRMRQRYQSAYAVRHGREPEYTSPTPLPRSKRLMARTLVRFLGDIRLTDLFRGWRGTIDYIFVDPDLRVVDCRLILDRPRPDRPNIYPSDHFGLSAELEMEHE